MTLETHVEELIPFYALGALDAREAERVEKHLPTCAQCRAILDEVRGGAEALPYAATPIHPSAQLKQRLMGRVQADLGSIQAAKPTPVRLRGGWFNWLLVPSRAIAIAAMILLIVSIAWAASLNGQVEQLRSQVNEQRAALALLSQSGAVTKELQATAIQPRARGQLIADPRSDRALLVVSGLKPLPAGRVYQAWLIKGKTPIGVGTFIVDANGSGQILINAPEAIGAYQLAALTEEPAGGSPLPTTEILMASPL